MPERNYTRYGLQIRSAFPCPELRTARSNTGPLSVASDRSTTGNGNTELPKSPPWRQQLIAERDGVPFGFLQIIDPDEEESHDWGEIGPGHRSHRNLDRSAAYLGKGYDRQMMRSALQFCFADPSVQRVLTDPLSLKEAAIRFYQRLGFRPLERRQFGPDDCLVHLLDRQTHESL